MTHLREFRYPPTYRYALFNQIGILALVVVPLAAFCAFLGGVKAVWWPFFDTNTMVCLQDPTFISQNVWWVLAFIYGMWTIWSYPSRNHFKQLDSNARSRQGATNHSENHPNSIRSSKQSTSVRGALPDHPKPVDTISQVQLKGSAKAALYKIADEPLEDEDEDEGEGQDMSLVITETSG
jgi:hypothetical protein